MSGFWKLLGRSRDSSAVPTQPRSPEEHPELYQDQDFYESVDLIESHEDKFDDHGFDENEFDENEVDQDNVCNDEEIYWNGDEPFKATLPQQQSYRSTIQSNSQSQTDEVNCRSSIRQPSLTPRNLNIRDQSQPSPQPRSASSSPPPVPDYKKFRKQLQAKEFKCDSYEEVETEEINGALQKMFEREKVLKQDSHDDDFQTDESYESIGGEPQTVANGTSAKKPQWSEFRSSLNRTSEPSPPQSMRNRPCPLPPTESPVQPEERPDEEKLEEVYELDNNGAAEVYEITDNNPAPSIASSTQSLVSKFLTRTTSKNGTKENLNAKPIRQQEEELYELEPPQKEKVNKFFILESNLSAVSKSPPFQPLNGKHLHRPHIASVTSEEDESPSATQTLRGSNPIPPRSLPERPEILPRKGCKKDDEVSVPVNIFGQYKPVRKPPAAEPVKASENVGSKSEDVNVKSRQRPLPPYTPVTLNLKGKNQVNKPDKEDPKIPPRFDLPKRHDNDKPKEVSSSFSKTPQPSFLKKDLARRNINTAIECEVAASKESEESRDSVTSAADVESLKKVYDDDAAKKEINQLKQVLLKPSTRIIPAKTGLSKPENPKQKKTLAEKPFESVTNDTVSLLSEVKNKLKSPDTTASKASTPNLKPVSSLSPVVNKWQASKNAPPNNFDTSTKLEEKPKKEAAPPLKFQGATKTAEKPEEAEVFSRAKTPQKVSQSAGLFERTMLLSNRRSPLSPEVAELQNSKCNWSVRHRSSAYEDELKKMFDSEKNLKGENKLKGFKSQFLSGQCQPSCESNLKCLSKTTTAHTVVSSNKASFEKNYPKKAPVPNPNKAACFRTAHKIDESKLDNSANNWRSLLKSSRTDKSSMEDNKSMKILTQHGDRFQLLTKKTSFSPDPKYDVIAPKPVPRKPLKPPCFGQTIQTNRVDNLLTEGFRINI